MCSSRTQGDTRPNIAVIDDDPSFLRSVSRLLRVNGYGVCAYSSPRSFLESLPMSSPDCLVVDLHMPQMTGLELLKQLSGQGRSVPAILVTAHETPQTREAALQVGVCALLPKPFEGATLIQTLSNQGLMPGQPQA